MMHSFNLNKEDEELFQKIIAKEKSKSESAIIRDRIFRRRERHQVKPVVADLTFLSQVSNLVSSMLDNLNRGNSIEDELNELKQLLDKRLNDL